MNAEPVVLTAFLASIECANPVPSLQELAIFFSIFLSGFSKSDQASRGGQCLAILLAPGAQLQIAGIRGRARLGGSNPFLKQGPAAGRPEGRSRPRCRRSAGPGRRRCRGPGGSRPGCWRASSSPGWPISDSTPPRLSARLNSFVRVSMRRAASLPPLRRMLIMPPKSRICRRASSWPGWLGRPG